MSVDWSSLEEAARSPDPNARAGAIIRAQSELERFVTASGWQREGGESLYQLLVRVRKQTNTPWISDDIGWAIKLRNAVAHDGDQPNNLDSLRAVQAYQDTATKLGWQPDDTTPEPEPEPEPEPTSEPTKTPTKKKTPAKKKRTPAKKAPAKKASPRKRKKKPPEPEPAEGGWWSLVVVILLLVAVIWGVSRLSQMTTAPSDVPALRQWTLPMRASASSANESCRRDPSPEKIPCAGSFAIDGDPKTAWCEGADGPGVGERLTVYLPEPATIEAIRLKAGYQKDTERFEQNSAPTVVTLLAGERSIRLPVEPILGTFSDLRLPVPIETDAVTLVIEAARAAPSPVTCISELELQVRL